MSGLFKPLLIGLGIVSSVLCAWIVGKLGLYENSGNRFKLLAGMKYLFWLIVEIGKADWAVAKSILGMGNPLNQQLIKIPANQKGDTARMIFANSITITPGTVCVDADRDEFIIHTLNDNAADCDALERMNKRVCSLERSD